MCKDGIFNAGVAEASEMWVCKLVMFIQILREIHGLHQRKELKSCTPGSVTPVNIWRSKCMLSALKLFFTDYLRHSLAFKSGGALAAKMVLGIFHLKKWRGPILLLP